MLVAYDVATPDRSGERRLARVAAVCERYGSRVQFSVFECRLGEAALQRLINELADEIDHQVDSIRIYRFAGRLTDSLSTLGRGAPRNPGDPWIL